LVVLLPWSVWPPTVEGVQPVASMSPGGTDLTSPGPGRSGRPAVRSK
jgi:hypothetical protein